MRRWTRCLDKGFVGLIILSTVCLTALFTGCGEEDNNETVLRVCNWEEYIDEGDWDDDERIDLDNGESVIGVNPMYEDFEEWYYKTYGKKVKVEYSCFGTNEDLYNQLTIGDTFDLVCPSEYMIMKLMAEDKLIPYSDDFFDRENKDNYYINGVSPYIKNIFDTNYIGDESWGKYAAGYMWGTTGVVYNPEIVSDEDAAHWNVLTDKKYKRRITVKDNVRDAYFAALGIYKEDLLTKDSFVNADNYEEVFAEEMNDTSDSTIAAVEKILRQMKDNAYSFETDSGKADMVTGKVVANYQWSGDAVYTMSQASEDDISLSYQVPEEGGNLWFDGWVMLKEGIGGDSEKQQAAQAFVNYLSRPDNAIRNMYYIGYTSVIAGAPDDDMIIEYAKYNYEAEDEEAEDEAEDEGADEAEDEAEDEGADETEDEGDEESADEAEDDEEYIDYDISYFFINSEDGSEAYNGGDDEDISDDINENDDDEDSDEVDSEADKYVIHAGASSETGELGAQYPTLDVIKRCAVMRYFDKETSEKINKMWVNVRCFNPFE